VLPSNRSISVGNWLRVWCSFKSLPPPIPAPLCLPTASISSIKIEARHFSFWRTVVHREANAAVSTNSNQKCAKWYSCIDPLAIKFYQFQEDQLATPLGIRAYSSGDVRLCWEDQLLGVLPLAVWYQRKQSSNLTPVLASIYEETDFRFCQKFIACRTTRNVARATEQKNNEIQQRIRKNRVLDSPQIAPSLRTGWESKAMCCISELGNQFREHCHGRIRATFVSDSQRSGSIASTIAVRPAFVAH